MKLQAVDLLKFGGTLVYSTCTTTVEENEGLVEWALQQHKSIKLSKQVSLIIAFSTLTITKENKFTCQT